jgi:hypothetical protein
MRGSLHCAADDETVLRFGRDDDWFGRVGKTTAKTTAGPSTALFAKCANGFAQDDNFIGNVCERFAEYWNVGERFAE